MSVLKRRRGKREIIVFMFIFFCLLSLFISAPAYATAPVHILHQFDPTKGEFAENLVLDQQGNIYVSLLAAGIVLKIAPDGKETPLVLPVGQGGSVTGLAIDQDQLFVGVASEDVTRVGVWQVDLRSTESHRVAALPLDSLPNGLSIDARGNIYVADSKEGIIWRIPHGGREASLWLKDQLIAPVTQTVNQPGFLPVTLTVGPNGLKFWHGALYTSVSGQGTIVKIPLLADGSAGTPQVVFSDVYVDDFSFDRAGNIYAAASREGILATEIERIRPDGSYSVLATMADDLDMPSAVAFGTASKDCDDLYITSLAIFAIDPHPNLAVLQLK